MSTYPASLDDLGASNPSSSTQMDDGAGHAAQHADANDAIDAIQVTLGADPFGVTLLPDPTGADDDDVLAISSGAWVIAPPTGGGGGGGLVLQVVNATYSTTTTANSTTWVDTGLTATITPTSATSTILVFVSQNGCGKDTNDTTLQLRLRRDSTTIVEMEGAGGWLASSNRNYIGTIGTTFLDSPATTSAVTYKTQQASFNGGTNAHTQLNVGFGLSTSTITLMEIAG